jgi:hypothetical protein
MALTVNLSAARQQSQRDIIGLVQAAALEIGCDLEELESTDQLEVYCEIKFGRSILSIAKGWNDPGLRIFSFVEIPCVLNNPLTLGALSKHCSTSGIALTPLEGDNPPWWWVETVIYLSGFNHECFREVLNTFDECLTGLEALCDRLLLARCLKFSYV